MHHHNYVPPVKPKESKIEGVIIAIASFAVFALWGVLLALGV